MSAAAVSAALTFPMPLMASTMVCTPKLPHNTAGAPGVAASIAVLSLSSAAIWSCSTCMAVMIPIFMRSFFIEICLQKYGFSPDIV